MLLCCQSRAEPPSSRAVEPLSRCAAGRARSHRVAQTQRAARRMDSRQRDVSRPILRALGRLNMHHDGDVHVVSGCGCCLIGLE